MDSATIGCETGEIACHTESELTNGSMEEWDKSHCALEDEPALDNLIAMQDKRIRELENKLRASHAEMELLKKNLAVAYARVSSGMASHGAPQHSGNHYRALAPSGSNAGTAMPSKVMMSPVSSSRTCNVNISPENLQGSSGHNNCHAMDGLQPRVTSMMSSTSSGACLESVSPLATYISAAEEQQNRASATIAPEDQQNQTGSVEQRGDAASKRGNRRKRAAVQEGFTRYWGRGEHERFLEGVRLYGMKNYNTIAKLVGTRNAQQVRTHAQKFEMRLAREAARSNAPGEGASEVPSALAQVQTTTALCENSSCHRVVSANGTGGEYSPIIVSDSSPQALYLSAPHPPIYIHSSLPGSTEQQHQFPSATYELDLKSLPPRRKKARSSKAASMEQVPAPGSEIAADIVTHGLVSCNGCVSPVHIHSDAAVLTDGMVTADSGTEPGISGAECGPESLDEGGSELVLSDVLNDGYPESAVSEVPTLLPELENDPLVVPEALDTAEFHLWLKQE
mmetsp:Transcript_6547/g.17557  ORF Transcript_6547/g.17557 Transcript_6547/m.17557 type:complete len:510 (-) Transcript_6547:172-1701(-)